jgi:uncharacterized membrane protein
MKIKLSLIMSVASVALGGVLLAMAFFASSLLSQYAAFLSFLLLLFILGIIFAKFEESQISSKEVALIGILAAITAASRIPFAALPNIKPCTFLIIVTGLVFGALAGAMVGSMTAAVSNLFFGQGPWTPWEMVAWSMVGIVAGYIGKRYPNFGGKGHHPARDRAGNGLQHPDGLQQLDRVLSQRPILLRSDVHSWPAVRRVAYSWQRHLRIDTREAGPGALQAFPAAFPCDL